MIAKTEVLISILLFFAIAILVGILIVGLKRNKQFARAVHNRSESRKRGKTCKNLSHVQAINQEKRRLRQMLLEGEIRVDTYRRLLAEIK
ncbi:hypothetical protein Desaci_3910 [Desulfosporosinus acidiphilus SJ4]|uniref:Uncharacterized protein n=1 Tax=Desulfosporosinus acidiphilus (strain DSM 22704 / JCM 16185 / SJ4) TaxID=646529 RepID=I4DAG2_DESAJ|nr:hypothetical protein [Desulfosporosinus acidiphilus]AFM42786.1 hypothetical protein Desaci_3910 [Desulfosporosinus acidiphilus SJ4]